MPETPAIETFASVETWAEAIAARLAETLGAAVRDHGQALFAGPGGSTPAPVYRRLAATELGQPSHHGRLLVVQTLDQQVTPVGLRDDLLVAEQAAQLALQFGSVMFGG